MTAEITVLDNGIRVITDNMPQAESVALGMWVNAGAQNESKENNGISHLLEHMAFKGTTTRTFKDIDEEIENLGGSINAYTSREETAYYARMLKENADTAMDIIGDILQNPTFPDEELKKEKTVIIQEINQSYDTPDDYVFDLYQEKAFPNQPLGRPIAGLAENVKAFTRDDIQSYVAEQYVASQMVFSAAGNVNHDQIIGLAEKIFTKFPKKDKKLPVTPVYKGGDVRCERDIEQLQLVLGFNGIPYNDEAYYAANIMAIILGNSTTSRMYQEIREKRGLVYNIWSYPSFYRNAGMFNIYAGTSAESADELIPAVGGEIRKITEYITPQELARAKAQMKANILMSLESSSSRCDKNARQMLIFNRLLTSEEMREKIEAVSAGDVLQVAARIFSSEVTFAALGRVKELKEPEAIRKDLGVSLT
ncbi:MAG: insulinase family protein [Alphaproteobacteria bacterium]|nr:insulinase family protein [Alphaproteobacteria bacterium]